MSQLVNLLITLVWLLLIGFALWALRRRHLSDEAKAIWAALIVIIPFLGALALWLVVPNPRVEKVIQVNRRQLQAPEYRDPRRAGVNLKGVELG